MISFMEKLVWRLRFPIKSRIQAWGLCESLLTSGLEIEVVLQTMAEIYATTGNRSLEKVFKQLSQGLENGNFVRTVQNIIPTDEGMVFEGFGQIKTTTLFASATKIANISAKRGGAMQKNLAPPLFLIAVLFGFLVAAGAWFFPILEELTPIYRWPYYAQFIGDLSYFLSDNLIVVGIAFFLTIIFVNLVFVNKKSKSSD